MISGSSQVSYTGLSNTPAGIVSGSTQVSFNGITDKPALVSSSAQIVGYNVFATTGSNQFNGSQAITGSLTVTGQVVAQTLNVQQVTSSIVFSSGSNIFGNSLGNTQQFTGSVSVTGSLTVVTAGTELQVTSTGVNLGNALTDNHIISGSLRVNPNGLFVSGSGNVGIGTTSPRGVLDISSGLRTGTLSGLFVGADADTTAGTRTNNTRKIGMIASPHYENASPSVFGMAMDNQASNNFIFIGGGYSGYNAANVIAFVTGATTTTETGTERLRITSGGDVYIGDTTSIYSTRLHVKSTVNRVTALTTTQTVGAAIEYFANTSTLVGYLGNGSFLTSGAAATDFILRSENALAFNTNGSNERMRITSGGLVRIGPVTDSDGTLQVRGLSQNTYNSNGYNGTGANIRLLPSSTGGTNITTGISMGVGGAAEAYIGAVQQSNTLADIVFQIFNGSAYGERMRITSGGVTIIKGDAGSLIQQAVTAGSELYFQLHNSAGSRRCYIGYGSNNVAILDIWNAENGSIQFGTNNTLKMTIDSSGNIGAPTGTNIYNASDLRLKRNISTISNGLGKISALNPIKFNWVEGFVPSEDGKDMLGFVAQEVYEIIPEAVESFGGNSIIVNDIEIENPLRVNEKFIIPVLVKAIQELKSENDNLKSRLEVLEQS